MKKILILLVFLNSISFSQESKTLMIGPFISESAGLNIVVPPDGRKNGLAISSVPNFGITLTSPVSKSIDFSFCLDMAYSNQAHQIKDASNGEKYTHQISYLSISPYLNFEGLLFGFNFGFPQSANNGSKIDANIIKTQSEVKFGGNFNIFTDESGSVNTTLVVSMMLNTVYDNYNLNDPLKTKIPLVNNLKITEEHNPRIANITFSINYLFNLGYSPLK